MWDCLQNTLIVGFVHCMAYGSLSTIRIMIYLQADLYSIYYVVVYGIQIQI